MKKNRDFRPVFRFISEMVQDKILRRIGNCTQAFEWYQFQRP